MQLTFFVALLPFLAVVSAAPAAELTTRNCASIPSTANAAVRDQVYKIAIGRGVTAKVLLSTFEVSTSFISTFHSSIQFNPDCVFISISCCARRPHGSSRMSTTCESTILV